MKILHISKYYEPFKGGIEEVAKNVVKVFADSSDAEQKVLCFNGDGGNKVDEIDGCEVTRVKRELCLFSQPISFWYKKKLKEVLLSFKPDLIVFHYPNPYAAFFLLKLIPRNVKLVVYWHLDIVRQKFLKYVFHFQNSALLKRADKIIATSPDYMEGSPYLSKNKTKCVIVPNCINEKRLTKTSKSNSLFQKIKLENSGKVLCLSVGRLVPYKGYEYLIQSAKMLSHKNIVFYIIGTGVLDSKLRKMASSCGNVEFLGEVTDDELKAYYSAADIFCFPSITKNEAFGIALAEAMYFNLPAVTYTIKGSGVNYVSRNGVTGLEAPNKDVEIFADCVRKLAANAEMRKAMGEKAHTRVVENFLLGQFHKNLKKAITDTFVV